MYVTLQSPQTRTSSLCFLPTTMIGALLTVDVTRSITPVFFHFQQGALHFRLQRIRDSSDFVKFSPSVYFLLTQQARQFNIRARAEIIHGIAVEQNPM